ncbi:MAG: J domain-containing protein [Marinobacter sp.]|uniref:J domain-containing protein n=1 Tax=Marinobacter sp. TaxID=50741 RepID=UPI0034A07B6C
MNCWDVLGIEPTRDRAVIDEAYERQQKFASKGEQSLLDKAYRQALSDTGQATNPSSVEKPIDNEPVHPPLAEMDTEALNPDTEDRPLSENDHRVVRETVIQIRALLNDTYRTKDVQVWKAILAEPPSDQTAIRQQIDEALEKEVRPMAENGAFPPEVAHFLADWFGWHSLRDAKPSSVFDEPRQSVSKQGGEEEHSEEKPQSVNFWPAAIGWIVGLAILTSLFSNMGGGG